MNATEGKLLKVEFGSIKTKETIDGKTVVNSDQEYALLSLDTGETFHLSGKSGREVNSWGVGQQLIVTQDEGFINVEKA